MPSTRLKGKLRIEEEGWSMEDEEFGNSKMS
jgi:hypothetical protein